ncbi:F420-dependent oxidoreductase-like protein [Kribbella sp. VKM Ac-2527]|uniref:F420-dependent oxidoreductase-like protein n=1 Tax=Kribbella caucasensis TaxID=2512215 RepID=A0A4R6KK73_9ACTN|nr:LLM class F420-dependent oxidoreductase [Kribbella sp. VKM Ac-2527]TDO51727.1 F420-dependent oxidoreductase-like protein [Kribbella sp. VKM Ac-2527]
MELALHISDFTWTGGPRKLGPTLAQHVRDAEQAGITRITVMDHFWQIPQIGPVENEMLEAYTALGFIAAHTENVQLHTLVTGVTYREPALLAKAITTLDVLSGGRAGLGIGAAWNVDESEGLGFAFPPVRERFERLEDAIQICLQMWSDDDGVYDGTHYRLGRTLDSPGPLHTPYLMIGGGGEKRTLRLVAQYADACNLFPGPELPRKLDVLREHCDAVGRAYDEIEKTISLTLDVDESAGDLVRRAEQTRELGFTVAYVNAIGITEPRKIVDTLAEAASLLA